MAKINPPLDRLMNIIILYANTPPDPVENLRLIEKELLDPYYLDAGGQFRIWENVQSQMILSIHIETVIQIHARGLARAKSIFGNQASKDEFMAGVLGYDPSSPPEKERFRKLWDTAFHEVYGYAVASTCPCSIIKKEVLQEAGYLLAGIEFDNLTDEAGHHMHVDEKLIKPRWIKKRVNCLECDHLHFTAILDDLSKGSYHLLSESEIVAKYHKTTIEAAEFCGGKHPLRISTSYSYDKNDAAFPDYLEGMPCNLLVNLLSSGPYAKNIKHCPICKKFFFATDTKRKICYDDPSCYTKYERRKKQRQREIDPVKYV